MMPEPDQRSRPVGSPSDRRWSSHDVDGKKGESAECLLQAVHQADMVNVFESIYCDMIHRSVEFRLQR